ncbi:helix-turn-helix domain-containing protein [Taklimakanibacter lacteus]|uniref:helix-turn-helix domain-containing protein n=1 Tax=Taklimakanibacter lacteus TaxID=2268456 RepID=UPI000E66351F
MKSKTVLAKIREIRKSKGLTLEELSAACGLSVSQLSKIENGKARLTFDIALTLSGLLKVPVTAFLSSSDKTPIARRSITQAGGGIVHQTPGMRFEVLCSDFREKRNVFWRVVISARTVEDSGGWRSHPGEEFLHVLEGTLNLHTEHYEPTVLATGDSILFDASMPHAYVAVGSADAVVLMSNTVPGDMDLAGAPGTRRG